MRCPYCGGIVSDRASYCVHCGRDLTQPPPPLNYDIQVITKRSKKRTTANMVATISPKKAKPKRKRKNAVRQMKLL